MNTDTLHDIADANEQFLNAHLSELLPPSDVQPVIDWIRQDMEEQEFNKSLRQRANVVELFPGKKTKDAGMQSVYLDDLQLLIRGDYYEKPGLLSPEAMRNMVFSTPTLSAIIHTRIRQISRFCRVQESGRGPGFEIRYMDRDHKVTPAERKKIQEIQHFFQCCGWEFDARKRKALNRDSFPKFMAKLVRDSLIMDMTAIETEMKRDTALGIDGLYAIDGATIRFCSESGYRGDDSIIALQVCNGIVRTAYTAWDLIAEVRNPRTDIVIGGYGLSETELLIKVVTGLLNVMGLNQEYFDKNSIPPGVLHLCGNFDDRDLTAFRRYWKAMVTGGGGPGSSRFSLPVMVSRDQESKASFEKFGVDVDDMMFGKFVSFLTSIACSVYSIDPCEISFESFTAGRAPLSGSDTEEKLTSSTDKGQRPLMSFFEDVFSDYVVSTLDDHGLVFRWTGLDEDDARIKEERARLMLTVNELRARESLTPMDGPLGDAPLNPSLIGPWMQLQQSDTQASEQNQSTADDGVAGEQQQKDADEMLSELQLLKQDTADNGSDFWKSLTSGSVYRF